MVRGKGGMYAHLGTSDCREIEKMILAGDPHADLVFQAQAYQISKGIGLLSIVLKGNCDAIILTGGVARSKMLTKRVEEYVKFSFDHIDCNASDRVIDWFVLEQIPAEMQADIDAVRNAYCKMQKIVFENPELGME